MAQVRDAVDPFLFRVCQFTPPTPPKEAAASVSADSILRTQAQRGIGDFTCTAEGDQWLITIDATTLALPVSSVLGQFLAALSDRALTQIEPKEPSLLVPWKDAEDVLQAMEKRCGRTFTRQNVWRCVNRLRNLFTKNGINRSDPDGKGEMIAAAGDPDLKCGARVSAVASMALRQLAVELVRKGQDQPQPDAGGEKKEWRGNRRSYPSL